ncbi:ORC1-type DNA replication protein [Candidatus Bathyarchaeota archaeon]|nr:ORC1-type DNA replication protein [Candidatus Bathyarchaeota archaeon]
MTQRGIFIDEAILDISYVPDVILHREEEFKALESLFDHMASAPYEMSQKAVILGGVGSGKTLLAHYYGRSLRGKAERRRVTFEYIHVNCREQRGSLFMILSQVVKRLRSEFPERGYAANELMDILRQIMDEDNAQILLCLDEVDVLIENEGSDALYYLTRFHETEPDEPRRLSLMFISKDQEVFRKLDRSTLSSLQRNVIRMQDYDQAQLADILAYRVEKAFRRDTVPLEIVDFISELAFKENSDARYAIDVLHGSGTTAERSGAAMIQPEHVRNAAMGVFQTLNKESVRQLSLHEQLVLLAVARFFKASDVTHGTTGEIEEAYRMVCEEYSESPRGHTQYWKYLKNLKGLDFVNVRLQASSQGRTQLISLEKIPAAELEKEVVRIVGSS